MTAGWTGRRCLGWWLDTTEMTRDSSTWAGQRCSGVVPTGKDGDAQGWCQLGSMEMPRDDGTWAGWRCPGMVQAGKNGDAQGWWHTGRTEMPGDGASREGWRCPGMVPGGQDNGALRGTVPHPRPRGSRRCVGREQQWSEEPVCFSLAALGRSCGKNSFKQQSWKGKGRAEGGERGRGGEGGRGARRGAGRGVGGMLAWMGCRDRGRRHTQCPLQCPCPWSGSDFGKPGHMCACVLLCTLVCSCAHLCVRGRRARWVRAQWRERSRGGDNRDTRLGTSTCTTASCPPPQLPHWGN